VFREWCLIKQAVEQQVKGKPNTSTTLRVQAIQIISSLGLHNLAASPALNLKTKQSN